MLFDRDDTADLAHGGGMPRADECFLQVLNVHHIGAALLSLQRLVDVLHADHQEHAGGEVVVAGEPCRARLRVGWPGVDRAGRVGRPIVAASRSSFDGIRTSGHGNTRLERLQFLSQLLFFLCGQVE